LLLRKAIPSFLMPKTLRTGGAAREGIKILVHISKNYGWLKSKKAGRCIDADGEPIPWLTYPAIDFIKQLDVSDLSVFEYGSGSSTLFWAKRARKVVSVESDPSWFQQVASRAPSNTEVILASGDVEAYVDKITKYEKFDIIVIDGTGESRLQCCQIAPRFLSDRGFVILDDSDMWLKSAAALRNANLIQVDFTGLAPLNCDWHTTSLFFSRQYAIQPLDGHQPHKSVAQPATPWPDG